MIGIINVQWFDNPGAVLLCYAMQHTIEKVFNADTLVVDYAKGGNGINRSISMKIAGKIHSFFVHRTKIDGLVFGDEIKFRHANYEKFRREFLHRTERITDPFYSGLSVFDTFVVGSDVVWRPEIALSDDALIYFLTSQYAKKAKKIAYAASIGTDDKTKILLAEDKYRDLAGFDYLSVREKESARVIGEITGKKVECVADPVFLLDKEEWEKCLGIDHCKQEYIYLYILSYNPFAITAAIELAKKYHLKIVYDLHTEENIKLRSIFADHGIQSEAAISDGPVQFLARISNASYIVTNSFHGTAFSIIFYKRFFSYSSENAGSNTSIRLTNLLEQLGIEDRFNCKEVLLKAEEELNAADIKEKLYDIRNKGLLYLKGALG